jgi:hypothetical protein
MEEASSMTEPSPARPVPGPSRPGSGPTPQPTPAPAPRTDDQAAPDEDDGRFADLDQRPVAEHVAVFEAEHDRLQRELGTIDRL